MPGCPSGTISAIRATWNLFWGQNLGRVLVVILAGFVAVYLFEIGSATFRVSYVASRSAVPPRVDHPARRRTRTAKGTEERRFWNFIALGMIVWLAGSPAQLPHERLFGSAPWADLATECSLHLGLYLCWFLASDQQPHLENGWSTRDVLYRFSLIGASRVHRHHVRLLHRRSVGDSAVREYPSTSRRSTSTSSSTRFSSSNSVSCLPPLGRRDGGGASSSWRRWRR